MKNNHTSMSNQIVLSTEIFNEISKVLKELEATIRAEVVVFCEAGGVPITDAGNQDTIDLSALSSLAAGNVAATREMARMLGESDAFKFVFLEGDRYNLYLCNVGTEYLLTIAIGKSVALGMLRIYANRAVKQLEQIIEKAKKEDAATDALLDGEFAALLGEAFDASFRSS